ncbi:MAG: hypothetical protein ACOCO1_07480, partial [Segatella copri]
MVTVIIKFLSQNKDKEQRKRKTRDRKSRGILLKRKPRLLEISYLSESYLVVLVLNLTLFEEP